MMEMRETVGAALLLLGAGFFFAGTVGLLRFPDLYTRLHAVTKVDNLGLGFVVAGLIVQAPGVSSALKLALVWVLAMAASATVSFLIARRAFLRGVPPWRSPGN